MLFRSPPLAYPDTGLLLHWGLRLDAPDVRGLKAVRSGDVELVFLSPGNLVKKGGACRLDIEDIMGKCAIGKGRSIILADADWLDVEAIKAAGGHPGDNVFSLVLLLSELGVDAKL